VKAMLVDISIDGHLLLQENDYKVSYADDGNMFFQIPLEDALYLLDWLTERKADLETLVREQVQQPGAMAPYLVFLWGTRFSIDPAFMEIEASNALDAVKLAMQKQKASTRYRVEVVSTEKSVAFHSVQMQGDAVTFAYCQTKQKK
jgi:hypothetical protein